MNLIDTVRTALRRRRAARGILAELSQMSDAELDEFGLCHARLGEIARDAART